MRAETIPLHDGRWRELVDTDPAATPFHLPEWTSTITDCYRFDAEVLAVLDTDGEVLGGVPFVKVKHPFGAMRWISLPFTDMCSIVLREGVDADAAMQAVRELVLGSETSDFELRDALPDAPCTEGCRIGHHHLVELHTEAEDYKMKKGHRQTKNRAVRDGVRVVRGTSREEMDTFYRLHTMTRRRHGVPVQPRKFFDLLQERMLDKGHGFISTAWVGDTVAASGIYLAHNETVVAKYHASDPAMRHISAGYVVDWETFLASAADGYRYLEMGRTDEGAEGLRRYKSAWGAIESPLIYTHISERPVPTPVLTGGELSHAVVRHSPLWVCRALGEVLYRWTA